MSGCGYWDMVDSLAEEFDAQQVLPKLFIGSAQAANSVTSLKDNNITHVLSISTKPPVYRESQFQCLSISIEDEEKKDLQSYFDQAHKFINQGRSIGGVLIHCSAGVSRSATIVISYLMSFFFKPFMYCFQYLKSIRPCIQPNRGFITQLISYESLLLQKTTQQLQQQISAQQTKQLCSGDGSSCTIDNAESCCNDTDKQQYSHQESEQQQSVDLCQENQANIKVN